jgi:hypothetical protein
MSSSRHKHSPPIWTIPHARIFSFMHGGMKNENETACRKTKHMQGYQIHINVYFFADWIYANHTWSLQDHSACKVQLFSSLCQTEQQKQQQQNQFTGCQNKRCIFPLSQYSKTCEIRTPLGWAKSVPYSEVSSFQRAICTENSSLGPDEVSLISQDVLISQGCYSHVSLYRDTRFIQAARKLSVLHRTTSKSKRLWQQKL